LLVAALLCFGFFPQFFVRSVALTFETVLSANADKETCSHGAVHHPNAAAGTDDYVAEARLFTDLATK